ncbi:MAG: hypothetical protein HYV15_04045, partial [Elusimicrobia bacterium]|nr:hypothetical protein [Elusimicrobiota bacterium]
AKVLDPFDRYCRYCGKGQGEHIPWYYSRWGIAAASLLGLGPFGVLLVWRSPRLSGTEKAVWTAALLALTGYVCWRLYQVFAMMNAMVGMALRGF